MSERDTSAFKHLSFEDAYAKLEKIVEQLETNSLPLDESMSLFEEGQQLSSYCQQLLDKAELRVSTLISNNGIVTTSEVASADDEDDTTTDDTIAAKDDSSATAPATKETTATTVSEMSSVPTPNKAEVVADDDQSDKVD